MNNEFIQDIQKWIKDVETAVQQADIPSTIEKLHTIFNKHYVNFLIEWKKQHEVEYKECCEGFERVSVGDYSMFEKLFSIGVECVPSVLTRECQRLFGIQAQEVMTEEESDEIDALANHDGYLKIFTDDEGLNADLVTEKEEQDTSSLYIRTKGEDVWWQSVPMQYRMIAQLMLLGKSEKEIAHQAMRILLVAGFSFPEMLERLFVIVVERQDPVLLSSLHYVAIDHGFRKLSKLLGGLSSFPGLPMFIPSLATNIISKMTETSLKSGYDKKADWKKDFGKTEKKDVRLAVLNSLGETQAKHGRHRVEQQEYDIDDYLIGDKERLKAEARKFLNQMGHDSDIAYLWKVLNQTGHIKDVSFPDYHRALEKLCGRSIKYDRAQRLFTRLTVNKKEFEASTSRATMEGKRLIERWGKVFMAIPVEI